MPTSMRRPPWYRGSAVGKRAVRHGLDDPDRVKAALEAAYKANAGRLSGYAPSLVWRDARTATMSLSAMAKTITADLTITDTEVVVDSKVPFLFSAFEGRIMDGLSDHLEAWFAKARASDV
jgi:hypothetical protein